MILIVNRELIYGRCVHLRSPLPGIGELAGEEVTELRSPNFPGIYARCTGSLPDLGLFGAPAAYASADPITGLQRKGVYDR